MFTYLYQMYCKSVVVASYHIGDLLSRIDNEVCGELYQKCMRISFDYDEKINFWFWKYPNN